MNCIEAEAVHLFFAQYEAACSLICSLQRKVDFEAHTIRKEPEGGHKMLASSPRQFWNGSFQRWTQRSIVTCLV